MDFASKNSPSEPPEGVRSVLVCDDERHIVRLIEVNLERQGYSIDCSYSGSECLAKLANAEYNLLILDSDMKSPSALEMIEAVRCDPRHDDMKILLMGERPEDWDPPAGTPAIFIPKPFNPALAVVELL